ncbi:MAG: glycosyltransferase [Nitrososphaeria archaeon]
MKILQVYKIFNSQVASGAARVAYNLSKQLAKRGHRVVFYASDMYDCCKRSKSGYYKINGIGVHRFKTIGKFFCWLFKIYFTPSILSLRYEIKSFDIIHLHDYISFQNIIVAYFAKKYKIPYILQAHGSIPRTDRWKKLKWLYDIFFGYRLLREASRVIALNLAEAEHYKSIGILDKKISIIPNGIDLYEYANLPAKGLFKNKFGIPNEKKIILYLGRIHKTKGIDFIIKAYAHLTKKMNVKDTVLVIAGPDDGYLSETIGLAKRLGITDSVMFTLFISEEDKLKALVDAEVFLTPSFYGFPMTFLEACVTGTPIVTTNLGDTLEWIDNKIGYVTKPIPCDMAEAIYNIISNEGLRKRFSKNCIDIVKSNFLMEDIAIRLEKVYEEAIKESE